MAVPDDLSEVGPKGERWWAFERLEDGKMVHGSFHALMFLSLEEIMKATAYFNRRRKADVYRAFLAEGQDLRDPAIYPWSPWNSQKP